MLISNMCVHCVFRGVMFNADFQSAKNTVLNCCKINNITLGTNVLDPTWYKTVFTWTSGFSCLLFWWGSPICSKWGLPSKLLFGWVQGPVIKGGWWDYQFYHAYMCGGEVVPFKPKNLIAEAYAVARDGTTWWFTCSLRGAMLVPNQIIVVATVTISGNPLRPFVSRLYSEAFAIQLNMLLF